MIICVDFDGTVVEPVKSHGNPDEVLVLRRGAERALRSLKEAGHKLVLSSARSNAAHRINWRLNPLWAEKTVAFDVGRWEKNREYWEAAHELMVRFVEANLPGVFDAVDEGLQGKVVADVYLDDRGFRMGRKSWGEVEMLYGVQRAGDQRGQG